MQTRATKSSRLDSLFLFLILSLLTPLVPAQWRGYNIKSYVADGVTCKTRGDWSSTFMQLKQLPGDINAVRLFASATCDTLANAVPEAIATGTYLLVNLNDHNETIFVAEKQSLYEAVNHYGVDWIAAIAVGSESLFRHATTMDRLIAQIEDIRGMLHAQQALLPAIPPSSSHLAPHHSLQDRRIEIGHIDTTNTWFNTSHHPLIRACDFIGMNVYPYFQRTTNIHNIPIPIDNSISAAPGLFAKAVSQAEHAVETAGSTAKVWITESGWPVNGPVVGSAWPGVKNAQRYWRDVGCGVWGRMNIFWFTYQDWFAVPSFAVVGVDGQRLYDMNCY